MQEDVINDFIDNLPANEVEKYRDMDDEELMEQISKVLQTKGQLPHTDGQAIPSLKKHAQSASKYPGIVVELS